MQCTAHMFSAAGALVACPSPHPEPSPERSFCPALGSENQVITGSCAMSVLGAYPCEDLQRTCQLGECPLLSVQLGDPLLPIILTEPVRHCYAFHLSTFHHHPCCQCTLALLAVVVDLYTPLHAWAVW